MVSPPQYAINDIPRKKALQYTQKERQGFHTSASPYIPHYHWQMLLSYNAGFDSPTHHHDPVLHICMQLCGSIWPKTIQTANVANSIGMFTFVIVTRPLEGYAYSKCMA